MASDGQVVFEISADNKKAKTAISETTEALKKAGNEWERTAAQSGEDMTKAFAKSLDINRIKDYALKAGKALLDFGRDAVQVASDLQEVQNVVDVTFGSSASEIDAWAKAAGTAFGLTELQAKKYTSTIGAMMKSQGIAGDEVVEMSERLAGLAADMASFYNLDFDTAFQKIRSGISGITMPLKELGIDLSVDTLNAFALAQGLEKTYSQMSQSEQTMIRYQYLMQATADAQGDFARTAETSFANMTRQLQTNVENIKASLGNLLLPAVQEATGWISDLLGAFTQEKPRTLLDEIADIDLKTEQKISEIEYTADKATSLLNSLRDLGSDLGTPEHVTKYVGGIVEGISGLDKTVTGAAKLPDNLGDLLSALSTDATGTDVKDALKTASEGVDALNTVVGTAKSKDTAGTLGTVVQGLNLQPEVGKLVNGLDTARDAVSGLSGAVDGASGIPSDVGEIVSGLNTAPDGTLAGGLKTAEGAIDDLKTAASGKDAITGDIGDIADALKTDASADDLISDINGTKGAVEALDGALAGASDIPENVRKVGDGISIDPKTGNLETDLSNVKQGISDLASAANGASGVPTAVGDLVKGLNVTTDGTLESSLGGVRDSVNGVADEIAQDKTNIVEGIGDIAEGVDVTPETDNLLGGMGDVVKGISDLETAAGKESDIKSDVDNLASDLNPTVNGNFAETVEDVAGAIGTLAEKTASAAGAGAVVGAIAEGANKLNASSPLVWVSMFTALKRVDGLENIFTSGAAGNVEALATALSSNAPDSGKAEAWQTFLDALGTNAGALSTLTGTSAEETAAWLNAMKEAAKGLNPTDAAAWNTLLGSFVTGLPALKDTETGEDFFNALTSEFLAMGNQSEIARQGLAALGYESDDIANAQKSWLGICKNLVSTIPQLSSLIDLQTGEIKGGTQAVEEYIKAWKADQILQTQIDALKQRRAALEQELNVDRIAKLADARSKAYAQLRQQGLSEEAARSALDSYANGETPKYTGNFERGTLSPVIGGKTIDDKNTITAVNDYINAVKESAQAEEYINLVLEENDSILAGLEAQTGKNRDELLGMGDAAETAAAQMSLLDRAASDDADALTEVQAAVDAATNAFKELADYQEQVRGETEQTVKGMVKGFEELVSPMQRARNEVTRLNKELWNAESEEQMAALQKELDKYQGEASQISVYSMQTGLESQLRYMQQYNDMLAKARANGVSDALLGSLSDGSQESFDYLLALTDLMENQSLTADEKAERIKNLNDTYAQVQAKAQEFTDTLTEQKLTADETYQSLVTAAQNAAKGLDVSEEAYASVEATVDAIAQALADKGASVTAQVDAIVAQISRLKTAGIYGSVLGGIRFYGNMPSFHANGTDYVPYDGYLAMLHQGERIQTAAEADLARRYSYTQPTMDYAAMGGAIGANIGRGNVYLDGKIVGNILSDRQANSYRALERSGWQG